MVSYSDIKDKSMVTCTHSNGTIIVILVKNGKMMVTWSSNNGNILFNDEVTYHGDNCKNIVNLGKLHR